MSRVLVGIPAYNVQDHLGDVIRRIDRTQVGEILVVNDGSRDATATVMEGIPDITRIAHPFNRGYGATQKTILSYFDAHYGDPDDLLVFLHGDGEMKPEEVPLFIAALRNDPALDVVFGSRPLKAAHEALPSDGGRPSWKQHLDHFITAFLNRCLGLEVSTYFGGYRAIRRRALDRLPVDHLDDRHAFDQQLIVQLPRAGLRVREIPISNVETGGLSNYSRAQVLYCLLRLMLRSSSFWTLQRQATPCPVCDLNAWQRDRKGRSAPESFSVITSDVFGLVQTLYRCFRCGWVRVDPREVPSEDTLAKGYEGLEDPHYLEEADSRVFAFSKLLARLRPVLPAGGQVLEIGCGAGFFLKAARDAGYTVRGIEPSAQRAAHAARSYGIPVDVGPFERVDIPASSIDLLVLSDVLEHVVRPDALLRFAVERLKPGGRLLLIDPDIECLTARVLGSRWWGYNQEHFHYPGRRTLIRFVEKFGCRPVYLTTFTRYFSLLHWLRFLRNYSPRLQEGLTRLVRALHLDTLRIPLNAFDFLVLVARKP